MTKTIESRLRRQAVRYGLRLSKSSRRDPNALDFGLYALIDVQTGGAVNPSLINTFQHSWTLEEVADYLAEPGPMSSLIRRDVRYADAETRGRLRAWKNKLAQNYAVFDASFTVLQGDGMQLAADMVKKTSGGRKAAFAKIHKSFGPGVTLESAKLGRNDSSMAIWSILKPRNSVTVIDALPEDTPDSERGSRGQDCVTVNYVAVGSVDGVLIVAEGLWTLEVPDHALGRAVQRSRLLQPETIIRDAHRNLLALPVAVIEQAKFADGESGSSYLKAGAGCFAGYFCAATDVSIGNRISVYFKVKTWLDENQMHDDQIVLAEKGEPGSQLGDGWFRPRPLCHIEQVGPNQLQAWGYR